MTRVRNWMERVGPLRACSAIVLGLTLLNFLVAIVDLLAGVDPMPMPVPIDGSFNDFFLFALSFPPGAAAVASWVPELSGHVRQAIVANPYAGVSAITGSGLTHLMVPPLTALYCIGIATLAGHVDAALLFLATLAGLALYAWQISALATGPDATRRGWLVLTACCYPAIMVLVRGNVYAGACSLLVVHAMLLATQRRAPALAGLLLAVAINIRPNAAIFLLPLLALPIYRVRALAVAAVATPAIAAVALAAAHALYPDYTLAHFHAALGAYYKMYVYDGVGLIWGSSLYGGLNLLIGYRPGLDVMSLVPVAALALVALLRWWQERLDWTTLLFLTCAGYALGTTVFGDYHLLVFMAVPMAAAIARRQGAPAGERSIAMLIATALILSPKNWVLHGVPSIQVLLNPLILLAAAVLVLRIGAVAPAPAPRLATA